MTRCVVGAHEHEAHHGLLCENHLQKLSAMLRDVEDETIHLSAVPSMQQQTGRGGSLASERAPVRMDVVAFRDARTQRWIRDDAPNVTPPAPKSCGPWCLFCEHESCTAWRAGRRRDMHDDEHDAGSDRVMSVLGVLHGWARIVREDRMLTPPEKITVVGERALLTVHLAWCAEQPFIDEMYAELAELLADLKRTNGTYEAPVGDCESLQPDGSMCGGKVWHVVIRHDDGPDEPGFRCGACRRVWTGTEAVRKRDDMWRTELARKDGKAS